MTDDESAPATDPVDEADTRSASWRAFWEGRLGVAVAAVLVAAVAGTLLFGQLTELGIWEPWEANDILVAQEYADRGPPPEVDASNPTASSYNWAVPTKDGEPIARSLLKTALVAFNLPDTSESGQPSVGALEWGARGPMAAAAWLLAVLGFFWMRRFFGTWAGVVTAVGFVSTPAIYMGAHTVSSELFFVVTTTAAILTFVLLVYDEGLRRWLWGPLFGIALTVAFLDQRFLALLSVLAVVVAFGLVQVPYRRAVQVGTDDEVVGPLQVALCIAAFAVTGGAVAWGFWVSAGTEEALLLAHVKQLLTLAVPTGLLVAGVCVAARTRPIRSLVSAPGVAGLAIAALGIGTVVEAQFDANPILLEHGKITGEIRVLSYLLENDLFGLQLPGGRPHFAMWIRQLAHATVPWAAFVPLGLGYLARSTRLCDDDGAVRDDILSPAASVKRLLLVWGVLGVVLVAGASSYGHYYFPAYFPLLAGVALMFDDADFWRWARTESLTPYLMGFVALALILMLTKDLSRFPARFIETYMMFEPEVGLPDEFAFGPILDVLRYSWMAVAALFFFGLASWAVVMGRRATAWPAKIGSFFAAPVEKVWNFVREVWWSQEEPGGESPARQRAVAKENVRLESGPVGAGAATLERSRPFSAVLLVCFVASAGIFLFEVAPRLGHHLSQRGIFESYTKIADEDEKLYRLRVSTNETSVYLRDVEKLSDSNAFIERFDQKQRFFVVMPRDRLSKLNKRIRREYDRNIPVLNAKSSRIVLASNRLEEGEEDQNFVADAIVDGEPDIQHEVTFEKGDQQVHPEFNGRLELLGYSLDKEGERPTYAWGETMELTTYYRVKRSVPTNQQVFLHVDYPGSRIHGDHYPNGGDFPTDDWLEGDVVRDVYEVKIDNYTSTGTYTIYTGFYRAGRRMQVSPDSAHDGNNRVPMGKIEVRGF